MPKVRRSKRVWRQWVCVCVNENYDYRERATRHERFDSVSTWLAFNLVHLRASKITCLISIPASRWDSGKKENSWLKYNQDNQAPKIDVHSLKWFNASQGLIKTSHVLIVNLYFHGQACTILASMCISHLGICNCRLFSTRILHTASILLLQYKHHP